MKYAINWRYVPIGDIDEALKEVPHSRELWEWRSPYFLDRTHSLKSAIDAIQMCRYSDRTMSYKYIKCEYKIEICN